MILLFGGTADTAVLAEKVSSLGYRVLVSTSTDISLNVGSHPLISRRTGNLDQKAICNLICEHGIKAIIDAAHPYAEVLHETVQNAALEEHIPCFVFTRPGVVENCREKVTFADNHIAAADLACSFNQPIFLTIGSKNIVPYVDAAVQKSIPLVVRVLSDKSSIDTCLNAGLSAENIIAERGPFSVDENRSIISSFGAGVLVTKDGGIKGGINEKLEAARLEGIQVVIIRRPKYTSSNLFSDVSNLIHSLSEYIDLEAIRKTENQVDIKYRLT